MMPSNTTPGSRLPLLLAFLFALACGLTALPLAADEPADEPQPDDTPVIHKIYIPFRDLSKVFEKEGEGVFLPYEEFLELWRKAHEVDGEEEGLPLPAAVRAAAYEGRADGDMVNLDATLEIEVLADGWQRIPLDFAGAGIEEARVDGEPALLVPAAQGGSGYELLLEDAGRRTLTLSLRIGAARDGDRHTAAFSLPAVPLSRLRLTVPGSATEIQVTPRLASTTRALESGRTELVAFLGPVSRIQIAWTQQVDEGPRVEPLVFADERHDVRVDRGVLRSELVADLTVLRAPLDRLSLVVPPDAVTLYVQGDGIRTWTRSEDGRGIEVVLREPVKDAWQLRLGLERPLPELPADVELPLAAIERVERETGFVRLLMGEGVKLEPRATPGLLQVDVSELPDPLKGAPPGRALAYRFPARPGAVVVAVEELAPRITTTAGTRLVVRPEGTDLRYVASLVVERTGIFGVELDLPADLEITAVRVSGVEYDDHKVNESEGRRWLAVEFRDRLLGAARLEVDGRLSTPLPESEEDESEVSFALPLPRLAASDHVNGYLAVHLDSALDHRVTEKEGLVVLDAGSPAATEPPAVQGVRVPLAYRFEYHDDATAPTPGLKRRAPAVTARVETAFRLEPDRMTVQAVLRYEVRYRGVDTLRFTAPLGLDTRMHLDLEGVQLLGPLPVDPGGEDGEQGERGIWTVKLPSPRTGVIPIPLEIEDVPEETLTSGESRPVVLPPFVPLAEGGEPLPNTVHDVAIQRNPLLEVAAETLDRAEEIDPRELPPALRGDDDFLAFRSYDPAWAVRLFVTRHDYEPVADVVISHMHLDTVLADDGRATTEAYLVVRSNNRQYLELTLPPNFTIRAVEVGGERRPPREGDEGRVMIPLPSGLGKDQTFVVALAYDHDVERSSTLGFATTRAVSPVAEDVTADLLTWRVFAPADRTYTSFGGSVEPADPHRSWFASLVGGLSTTLGAQAQGGTVAVARVARGFKSPFHTEHPGDDFLFSNRVGSGSVEITGVDPGVFAFFKLLCFAALLAAALLLGRALRLAHVGEGKVYAAMILVLLVLLVRAGPGTAQVLNAMLYGVLVAGLIRLVVLWSHARRERAAAAAEAAINAPDPVPEGGAA